MYQIEITTLTKKNSLFHFTYYCLSHCISLTIFSYSFYFSPFCLLSLTQFFKTAPVLTLWKFTTEWPFPFISFTFSSFLPSILFASNHNKCKSLTLTLLQPIYLSSALIVRMALMHQPLISFLFFSSACPTRLSQPTSLTHADVCT